MNPRSQHIKLRVYRNLTWSRFSPVSLLRRSKARLRRSISFRSILIHLVIIFPLFGAFYPLESYLNAGINPDAVTLSYPVTTIFLTFSLLILFYEGSRKSVQRIYFRPETLLLIFYSLLALATFIWSSDAKYTLFRAARLVPPIGFGLILAINYDLKKICSILTTAFFITAAASVAICLFWPSVGLSHLDNGYEDAWRGILVHKNFAGFLFSIGVLIVGYAYKTKATPRPYAAITWLLCALMLVKSNSATSMVATAAALAVAGALVLARRTDSTMRFILICLFIILCLPIAYLITNPEIVSELTGRDMTFTGRKAIWQGVMKLISLRPIGGYGYGFWGLDTPARDYVWRWIGDRAAHSHNSWLDIWLQCGISGLLALTVIVLGALYRGITLFVMTRRPGVILFLAVLVSLLVRSFTEVEFTDPGISGVFWLALASGYFGKLMQARKEISAAKAGESTQDAPRNRQAHVAVLRIEQATDLTAALSRSAMR